MYPKQIFIAQNLYTSNKENFRDIKILLSDYINLQSQSTSNLDSLFNFYVLKDINHISEKLEIELTDNSNTPEFYLILSFVAKLFNLNNFTSELEKNNTKAKKSILDFFESSYEADVSPGFILSILNDNKNMYLKNSYSEFLFQFSKAVASSDQNVTNEELNQLNILKTEIDNGTFGHKEIETTRQNNISPSKKSNTITNNNNKELIDDIIKELDTYVGMNEIKRDIKTLINTIKIQKMREEQGLSVIKPSLHMIFTGPPGTGKTTIARIMGRVFKSLDILESGHLIETDRSSLVAGYSGQTAIKVDEQISKAKNGVLFIDEAYTLSPSSNQDEFGQEAIDTILKRMEDFRDSIIIIAAGYHEEMQVFIESNPGLKSRFNKYVYFEDYKPKELKEIFESIILKNKYFASAQLLDSLEPMFQPLYNAKNKSFGNGRLVRNIFEKTIENQANRLAKFTSSLSTKDLQTIVIEDLPQEYFK